MRNKSILVFCILFYLISSLWFAHFSLSLDELTTYWTIKDGFWQAFRRAWEYQGQTPLYYIFLWAWKNLFGSNEIVLRLPSIFFGFVAGIFTAKFSTKWFGDKVGFWTFILYFTSFEIVERTMLARTYGLGIMAAVCSIYFLESWLSNFNSRSKYLYVFFAILTVYSHYFFSGILVVHFLLILIEHRSFRKIPILDLASVVFPILLSLVFVWPQVESLSRRSSSLSWAHEATSFKLLVAWFPPYFFFFLLLVLAFFVMENKKLKFIKQDFDSAFLKLIILYFSPSLLLFIYCQISGNSIFADKYFCWAIPAKLILVAYLTISIIKLELHRYFIFSFIIFCNLFPLGFRLQFTEDWGKASEWINNQIMRESSIPIFLYSGLIESNQIDWLTSPNQKDYLSSPLSRYPINGKIYFLPFDIQSADGWSYLQKMIDALPITEKDIYIIKFEPKNNDGDFLYFSMYFEKNGFQEITLNKFYGMVAGHWSRK